MDQPIYSALLGLYLTVEEYRKHVKPGQKVCIWLPPEFLAMAEGIAGQVWGEVGAKEPSPIVKLNDGTFIRITNDNVFLVQVIH